MGRGLLLGIGWGVMVAGLAGTALSLIYSNDNAAPSVATAVDAPQQVEPAPEAEEAVETTAVDAASGQERVTEPEATPEPEPEPEATPAVSHAPTVGTVQAPSQGVDVPEENADGVSVPDADATDISTPTPASPQMAQSDVQPDRADAASVEAPDVMIPDDAGNDQATGETGVEAGAMASTDTPVTTASNAAQQDAPPTKTRPEMQTGSAAMTTPPMQGGPDAGDAAQITLQEGANAPDVQEAAIPNARQPAQTDSPQFDANLTEVPTAPAPPSESEPATPAPKPAGQFDSARVPVPKMANLAPNVKTNRLPTIGATSDAPGAAVEEVMPQTDARALAAYAMAFENPDAKPMFSVILIDEPENPVSNDVLSHLPFALTFAIDAARDDANHVAARYRAAGFEVLMLTNLPFGASATDIEVAFGAYSRAIPEAIGVLDLGANGFLRGPSTATQIAGIMSEHGFGLITPSKGLNSAQKAAMREGVPAVLLFRELDADGEKPAVIRRYLDRAAFRAAQEGSVIMLGHTRPETIEALVTWALEDRAASVAIAPASAVMLAQ